MHCMHCLPLCAAPDRRFYDFLCPDFLFRAKHQGKRKSVITLPYLYIEIILKQ